MVDHGGDHFLSIGSPLFLLASAPLTFLDDLFVLQMHAGLPLKSMKWNKPTHKKRLDFASMFLVGPFSY